MDNNYSIGISVNSLTGKMKK